MTTAITFLTIRAAHVLVAALWIGATVFSSALLMPAIDAAGGNGGQLMMRLNRRGFPVYMSAIATTTLASGLYLFWRFTGGFDTSVTASHAGLAFAIGGGAGILAGIIGGAVVARSAKRLVRLSGATTIADDHVHRALLAEIAGIKRRIRLGTRVVVGLQTVALVFMSVGHYV
jgi:uncharacterized membrane protein